ncbi:MAG TPA: methylcrotonoyl-CoA carboxylase, partial [Erythrobacter sp.]|nr:methylcrotonoyl-CoA carboxylase [Erythrobacter sp.]
ADALGIETVLAVSDADRESLAARMAGRAICIGPASAAASYLNVGAVLTAAKAAGADAIHPGYGFLAESPDLADACAENRIKLVGPSAAHMRQMGHKIEARALAAKCGVPTLPGSERIASADEAANNADRIGLPVMLKAASGGGGRGMKIVTEAAQLAAVFVAAAAEARAAFGDGALYLERYIANARHIEVQVLGDAQGNVIHLGERDCSTQRRHQKVIEEAPAPGMDEATREEICAAAVRAAKAVDYEGAGTIEFIADASEGLRADRIFLMEMNTRLQVEHPVTEEITRVDLVEWQLRVASGEPIPLAQDALYIDGHAIEARLYAEDPNGGFLPSTGALDHFDLGTEGRIETGVEEGDLISPFYDPMVAKLVVWGETRDEAIDQLAGIAEGVEIWPVKTNAAFIANCLRDEDFENANLDTGFIESKLDSLVSSDEADDGIWQNAADFIALAELEEHDDLPMGFRLNAPGVLATTLLHKGQSRTVAAASSLNELDATGFVDPARAVVFADGQAFAFERQSRGSGAAAAGDGAIVAPMPGKVIAVDVAEGDTVTAGQRLMVLEAMKMEHALTAPFDGTVTELSASEGGQVQVEAVLCVVEPAEE